jgi:hypothetical protein
MSTWTSRVRVATTLSLTVPLAACLGELEEGTLALRAPDTVAAAAEASAASRVLRRASLAGGKVVIAPPSGYCIDGDSFRPTGPVFALIAPCDSLMGRSAGAEAVVMTVTAQRSRADLPHADELVALLPRAEVLDAINGDGLTLLHLDGGVPDRIARGDSRHWRGMMDLNGHLLSLGLYAEEGSPMAGKSGIVLIGGLAESIRAASPVEGQPMPALSGGATAAVTTPPVETTAAAAQTASAPAAETPATRPEVPGNVASEAGGLKKWLGRLFF